MIFFYIVWHTLLLLPSLIKNFNNVRNSNVLVLPHLADLSFFVAYPFSKLFGIPIVYINHSGFYPAIVENRGLISPDSIAGKSLWKFEENIHKRADKIVVLSETAKHKFMEMYGTSEDTYEVVYVSVIPSYTEVERQEELVQDCDILYWGGFHDHHGVDTMIEAAEQLQELKFTFIGSPDEEKKAWLEDTNAENIIAPGFVELEDLVSHIETADVVLGPLSDNPVAEYVIGTKTSEATFFGKATVLGDQPAVNEIFEHRRSAYLVTPSDPDDLADGLKELMEDGELRCRLEENVQKCYEEYFSQRAAKEGYLQTINSVI